MRMSEAARLAEMRPAVQQQLRLASSGCGILGRK